MVGGERNGTGAGVWRGVRSKAGAKMKSKRDEQIFDGKCAADIVGGDVDNKPTDIEKN